MVMKAKNDGRKRLSLVGRLIVAISNWKKTEDFMRDTIARRVTVLF